MDFDTIKTIAMWALIAVAVGGILLAIIVQKIISKVFSLALAGILVFFIWQQREGLIDKAEDLKAGTCASVSDNEPTFFGFDIALPDDWCRK